MKLFTSLALLMAFVQQVSAQVNCSLTASYAAPVLRDGWEARLIVSRLSRPRSILFDSAGALLVVEQRRGIRHLRLADGNGTCFGVQSMTDLVLDSDLNHGLALSNNGRTLYASTADVAYAWDYDPASATLSNRRTVVGGMDSGGHTSRTLLMSSKEPGILVVSRGSDGNFDLDTAQVSSGRSQIKAFNMNNLTANSDPYEYSSQGRLLGWGLRNSVGVAEEPVHGGVYSVENSADQIVREGVDIHENNPGEEMNYHGFLNASTENQGGNYGYPYCLAAWDTNIPDNASITTGTQFSLNQDSTSNDTFCREDRVAPRLTFQAHMAPLDIKFLPDGSEAYVSFHGSWNRDDGVGYKVSMLAFSGGSPTAQSTSREAAIDIMTNPDLSACPSRCFRPTGLVLDGQQRLFMSSDSTGEIWVLRKTSPGGSATGTGSGSATSSSARPTQSGNVGVKLGSTGGLWGALLALFWMFA